MNCFEKRIQRVIYKHKLFKKKDTLILSFSGGPDSVCLLNCLCNLNYKNIILIYFDHQLRPQNELNSERSYIRFYAKKFGLKLKIKKIPIQKVVNKYKLSSETVGHLLRKELLQHYAEFFNADYILTAHHKDDAVETCIMNVLKGSFFSVGLQLKNITSKVPVVRPLFFSIKKQQVDYCKKGAYKYSSDSTNQDIKFKRNWIRSKLIPLLNTTSPKLITHLQDTHSEFIKFLFQQDHVQKNYTLYLQEFNYYYKCDMRHVTGKSEIDINRWVAQLLYKLYEIKYTQGHLKKVLNRYVNLNKLHIQKITIALIKNTPGKVVMIPKNIHVLQYNKILYFYSDEMLETKMTAQKLTKENRLQNLNLNITCRQLTNYPKNFLSTDRSCFINSSHDRLIIRFATKEDMIIPFGKTSKQSLWQYLAKQKLNVVQRINTVVICKEDKVVWVPGFCIDERFKVDKNSTIISEIKIQPLTDTIKHMISYK
jgi:tRNA(Ile)-lysidine synthase